MSDLEKKYGGDKFSYIYWPVCIENLDDLHITYKFLGDSPVSLNQMKDLFSRNGYPRYPIVHEWQPEIFGTKNDGGVKVLEFTKFDPGMAELRKHLDHLRTDDYPSWRPHVTVDEDIWQFIKDNGLKLTDVDFRVKPLEMKLNGQIHQLGNVTAAAPPMNHYMTAPKEEVMKELERMSKRVASLETGTNMGLLSSADQRYQSLREIATKRGFLDGKSPHRLS